VRNSTRPGASSSIADCPSRCWKKRVDLLSNCKEKTKGDNHAYFARRRWPASPVAQQLLQVKGPAHLAYNWRDGTPRVVPIGFHWNGEEIVMATAVDAPKTKVLTNGSKVAVSIDRDFSASKILLIRGTVRVDTVEGVNSSENLPQSATLKVSRAGNVMLALSSASL
jgi:hypothetical protein